MPNTLSATATVARTRGRALVTPDVDALLTSLSLQTSTLLTTSTGVHSIILAAVARTRPHGTTSGAGTATIARTKAKAT